MTDAQLSLLFSTIADALTRASGAFAFAARTLAARESQAPVQQDTPPASAGPMRRAVASMAMHRPTKTMPRNTR